MPVLVHVIPFPICSFLLYFICIFLSFFTISFFFINSLFNIIIRSVRFFIILYIFIIISCSICSNSWFNLLLFLDFLFLLAGSLWLCIVLCGRLFHTCFCIYRFFFYCFLWIYSFAWSLFGRLAFFTAALLICFCRLVCFNRFAFLFCSKLAEVFKQKSYRIILYSALGTLSLKPVFL